MAREDSLITVGQVKVFGQTAHRTAVFNSSVRGKKSEKSTQADRSRYELVSSWLQFVKPLQLSKCKDLPVFMVIYDRHVAVLARPIKVLFFVFFLFVFCVQLFLFQIIMKNNCSSANT